MSHDCCWSFVVFVVVVVVAVVFVVGVGGVGGGGGVFWGVAILKFLGTLVTKLVEYV